MGWRLENISRINTLVYKMKIGNYNIKFMFVEKELWNKLFIYQYGKNKKRLQIIRIAWFSFTIRNMSMQ